MDMDVNLDIVHDDFHPIANGEKIRHTIMPWKYSWRIDSNNLNRNSVGVSATPIRPRHPIMTIVVTAFVSLTVLCSATVHLAPPQAGAAYGNS